ncbi:hypothetical protein OE88DRAFT_1659138 [Heliocybe sulcata]|uniref:F-box domain-containing protein n=1 Tax=Heliocybe sulcata TaxID=5364 RepID=A0A5C3N2I1_9AGAM|nr:hypothetical protein OE88DRAFT_1659138 [Heliocybe sulcata]
MDEYYCSLCGGPFSTQERTKAGPDDPDKDAIAEWSSNEDYYYYDGTKISKEDMMWLQRMRVIAPYYEEREDGKTYPDGMVLRDGYWISGVGLECCLNEAAVPYRYQDTLPEDHEELDENTTERGLTVYGEFRNDEPRSEWSYPLHDACLQILEAALEYKQAQLGIKRIPWNVVHHVLGTHCDASCGVDSCLQLDYEHTSNEQYWSVQRGQEEYVSDPVNVRALQDLLSNPPPINTSPSPPLFSRPLMCAGAATDILSRLPWELLFHLVAYLPTPAVAALRMASRAVAVLRLESSQAFWRSRVMYAPYVLEADLKFSTNEGGDWRKVFMMLKEGDEGELEESLGWKNRRRIWRVCMGLVEEAAGLVIDGAALADGGDDEEHLTLECSPRLDDTCLC